MPDPSITALRGTIVSFTGDPFLTDPAQALVHEPDGLIICRDGLIEAVGAYDNLRGSCQKALRSLTIPAASSRQASSTLMCIMCRPR
jgi:hypothetical protein